jgi:hypothetical protein
MAYRLMVLGGQATQPVNNTYVVRIQQRTDGNGNGFCEVVSRKQYARPEEAKAAASQQGDGSEAVGLTPWQPAFSTTAITGLKVASEFRDPGQAATESPMVRIFEVTRPVVPSPGR